MKGISSPLAVIMLHHFYALSRPFMPGPEQEWPPAQQEILANFINRGLIVPHEDHYKATAAGVVVVQAIERTMRGQVLAFQNLSVTV